LFGRTILVARPSEQSSELADPLEQHGAQVLLQPAIEIGPPSDWGPVDRVLSELSEFQWIVFSSSNGVHHFLDRMLTQQRDMRSLASTRIAAIGPGTAAALRSYSLIADLLPQEYRAESLAAALAPQVQGQRVLLIRASRGREVLADELRRAMAQLEQVVAYSSTDVQEAATETFEKLTAGQVDFVAVTSSAIARSLVRLFGDALRKSRLVSISPVTSETLRELGYEPSIEATSYTMQGVVDAILSATQAAK
jgi:uroporphyrinogen III methyltransferase/synthase